MNTLYLTVTELWPNKARKILEEKKINPPNKKTPAKILNDLQKKAGLKVFKFIKENCGMS